jgi:hypothetical protein
MEVIKRYYLMRGIEPALTNNRLFVMADSAISDIRATNKLRQGVSMREFNIITTVGTKLEFRIDG